MANTSTNNKRIAKNTLLLYFRMLFLMAISLYTSRITLSALGVEDYGIYNVIGGVVATFAFLRITLTTATQRFITFELGTGNLEKLKIIFANNLAVHLLLACIIIIIGEIVGVWFINTHLNVPEDRLFAANVVFQCSIGSFILNLINVPYNGLIIAHERMGAFAYISIFEAIIKLLIVYVIFITSLDKLILYSVLWLLSSIIIQLLYHTYCIKHFKESRVKPMVDKKMFKSLLSFSGYNLIEIFANTLANQGVNILLNLHFGPVVNAAQGIAAQVNGAINGFANNFSMALNPQITKNFASNQLGRMWNLVNSGNKMSFFLLLLISTPIYMKIDYILSIWLEIVPEYCGIFIRLMILTNLLMMMTKTFYTVISATGNIKLYQISFGLFRLTVFPACWFVLNYIYESPMVVFVIAVIYEALGILVKMILLKQNINNFKLSTYLKAVILPCCIVFILCFLVTDWELVLFSDSILGLLSYVVSSCLSICAIIYFCGLSSKEKGLVIDMVKNKLNK